MIRLAEKSDIDAIRTVYQTARQYMAENGNASQWGKTYPPVELIEEDIASRNLYLITENDIIHGVFAFIIGDDPTYSHIEDGSWLNNERYGTIHRIASAGAARGVFARSIDFCKSKIDNIRIDTHKDNHIMQHLVTKYGFRKCGIIYTHDGTPRIAYQYTRETDK